MPTFDVYPVFGRAGSLVRFGGSGTYTVHDVDTGVLLPVTQAGGSASSTVIVDTDGRLQFETAAALSVVITDARARGISTTVYATIGGGGGGEATDESVAVQIDAGAATQAAGDARWQRNLDVVSVKAYGAVGDGVTDNSAALTSALSANPGKTLYFPPGTYLCTSATRLVVAGNGTSLVGDPSGIGSTIKFTNAAGGLDLGNGTDLIYENRLVSLNVHGNSATTTLLRLRKVYEPFFDNLRLQSSSASADSCLMEINDSGQLDADRLVMSTAPIGIKFTGATTPIVNLRLANFYTLTECVRIATVGIARFKLTDSWIEACPDVFTINAPSTAVSIGELIVRDVRVLKATGDQRILRAVAASSVSDQSVRIEGCYIDAPASVAPLVDFTALNNPATFRVVLDRLSVLVAAGIVALVDVHASQSWFLFIVDVGRISDAGGRFNTAKWSKSPFAAGGTWPSPYRLDGTATPEGAVASPVGSTYQRIDGGDISLYVKTTGSGTTGWKPVAVSGATTTEAPMTFVSTDALNNDFALNILQAQRSWAESADPGAVVFGVNGAAQARIGWDDANSEGTWLAQALGLLMSYGPNGVSVLTGTDVTLWPKTDSDNVAIGRGSLRLSVFTTASRPTAATAGQGAVLYDSTVGKPIFSDGANWKTYDGTVV